jgi:hypothetical protein
MLQLWLVANSVLWSLSVNLGGMKLGLHIVVLILAGIVWLGKNWRIGLASADFLLFFFAYVLFSLLVAISGSCNDHFQKSLATIPVLWLLFLIGLEVGRKANALAWLKLQRTALWCLGIGFSTMFVELLHPAWFPLQADYRSEGKLSGMFSEPSGVASSLFPCVVILLVAEGKKTRRKGMLALLALVLLSRSSTLIALIVAFFLYRLVVQGRLRQTAAFVLGFVLLIGLGAAVNFSRFVLPTIERVAGVAAGSETENISSLVYVQGWQDALFNLRRTHGLGLGINMMGCGELPDVSARRALTLVGLRELNAEDGSFLFAKVVSEVGLAGIAFYIFVLGWWVRLERKLRYLKDDPFRFAVSAQSALIFCFVALSFTRGSGYFNGWFLLAVAAFSGATNWKRGLSNQSSRLRAFPLTVSPIGDQVENSGE